MRVISMIAVLAAVGASPSPQPSPSKGKKAGDFFGLNGVGFFHYRDSADAHDIAQRKMDALRSAGARWDRFDFWWGEIEPEKGKWKWDKADWIVEFYRRNGIGMLPILCYRANWMQSPPHTEEDFREFAEYVFRVVDRYKGAVKYWEIWNEPNIPTFWKPPSAVDYAKLLKAAYMAAKKADPNCVIMGASANETDVNWLLDIAKNGATTYMDVVSFHPYSMADGPEEMQLARQIENVHAVMAQIGRPEIPIWITEMGWIADINKPDEVAAQCKYMVQSHVIALAGGVEKLFWFNLQDWKEGEKLEGWGMLSPEGKAKATGTVYRFLVDKLGGAKFLGCLPLQNGSAYLFERAGKTVVIAWARRGQQTSFPVSTSAKAYMLDNARWKDGGNIPIVASLQMYFDDRPRLIEFARKLELGDVVKRLPEDQNLVVNPSFEMSDHGEIYGWHKGVFYGGEDKGTFERSTDSTDGKYSAALSKAESALWQSYPIPALPGEKYTLTAKIKTTAATGANGVQILFLSGPGWGWKGGPMSASITGTNEWQTVHVTGTVPADADVVRVNLVSKNNTGQVLFDDVHLERK
jgi:hypothetical protein